MCVQKNSSRTTLKAGVQRSPWWSTGGLSAYTAEGKLCGPSGKKKKLFKNEPWGSPLRFHTQKKSCVHALECLILLRCSYYPKRSIDSTVCQNTSGTFCRNRKMHPKTHKQPQGIPNSQNIFCSCFSLASAQALSSANVDPLDHQGKWKWSSSVVSDSLWPHGL